MLFSGPLFRGLLLGSVRWRIIAKGGNKIHFPMLYGNNCYIFRISRENSLCVCLIDSSQYRGSLLRDFLLGLLFRDTFFLILSKNCIVEIWRKNGRGKKWLMEKMADRKEAEGKNNNMKGNFSSTVNIFVTFFFYAYCIQSLNLFYQNHLIRQPANVF